MSAAGIYAGVLREVFALEDDLSTADWVARYFAIHSGDFPGPYDHTRTPYLRGIFAAFDVPEIRTIVCKGGSQTGKTAGLRGCLFRYIDAQRGKAMYVLPKDLAAAHQTRLVLMPAVEACDRIRGRLLPKREDRSAALMRFRGCDVVFRGAMTESNLETLDAGLVVVDEVDRCPPRTCHLAKQRGKTIAGAKVLLFGKPGLAGEGVDREYAISGWRGRYMVPCPGCGVYHERTFARLRWRGIRDGVERWDSRDLGVAPSLARETACLKCPNCKDRIGPEHNHWQINLGVWAHETQRVAPLAPRLGRGGMQAPSEDAGPDERWESTPGLVEGDAPRTDQAGFHVPELISGVAALGPYAGAVGEFVERGGVMDADLLADRLGLAYSGMSKPPEVKELRASVVDQEHRLGVVPNEVLALIAVGDVQLGSVIVSVWGYGAGMRRRWLVWDEEVPAPEGTGLSVLDEIFYRRQWPRANGARMRLACRGLDSGDRATEVYDYIRARPECYAIKGVGNDARNRMDEPARWSQIQQSPDGKVKYPRAVHLLRIDSHFWKSRVVRMLGIARQDAQPGLIDDEIDALAPNEGAEAPQPWYTLPRDVTDQFLEELTAEELVTAKGQGGRPRQEWRIRPGRRGNHRFDVACYAEALANRRGVHLLQRTVGVVAESAPEKPAAPAAEPSRTVGQSLVARHREDNILTRRRT